MSTTATDQGVTLTGGDLETVRRLADLAVIDAASWLCTPERKRISPSHFDLPSYSDLYSLSRARTALDPTPEPGAHFWPLDDAMVTALRNAAESFVRSGATAEADAAVDPWAAEVVDRGALAAKALAILNEAEARA